MKCRICNQDVRAMPRDEAEVDHHLMRSPVFPDVCLGCWMAGVQLELFLFRATGSAPMGPWVDGWLREMVKDPRRYL